jgi:hypothetical protein
MDGANRSATSVQPSPSQRIDCMKLMRDSRASGPAPAVNPNVVKTLTFANMPLTFRMLGRVLVALETDDGFGRSSVGPFASARA